MDLSSYLVSCCECQGSYVYFLLRVLSVCFAISRVILTLWLVHVWIKNISKITSYEQGHDLAAFQRVPSHKFCLTGVQAQRENLSWHYLWVSRPPPPPPIHILTVTCRLSTIISCSTAVGMHLPYNPRRELLSQKASQLHNLTVVPNSMLQKYMPMTKSILAYPCREFLVSIFNF